MNIAMEHFARRLEVETDVSDVAAAIADGTQDFVRVTCQAPPGCRS
jgi:hypothetical protein